MDSQRELSLGDLIEFVAPGVVHGLGNALFAIRGGLDGLGSTPRASLHGVREGDDRTDRAYDVARRGSALANQLLATLRALTGPPDSGASEPVATILRGVFACVRLPLRERGQALDWSDESVEAAVPPPVATPSADPTTVVRSVLAALLHGSRAIPSPGPDCIGIRLLRELRPTSRALEMQIEATHLAASERPLPFSFDSERLASEVSTTLHALVGDRARCEVSSGALVLEIELHAPPSPQSWPDYSE